MQLPADPGGRQLLHRLPPGRPLDPRASASTVVAIDVIRATTTAITAAALGHRCLLVASTEEALRAAGLGLPPPPLAGEIGGHKPDGFDLQNSPVEVPGEDDDRSRTIVLLSTSGTPRWWSRPHRAAPRPTWHACATPKRPASHLSRPLPPHRDSRRRPPGTASEGGRIVRRASRSGAPRAAGFEPEDSFTERTMQRWEKAPNTARFSGRERTLPRFLRPDTRSRLHPRSHRRPPGRVRDLRRHRGGQSHRYEGAGQAASRALRHLRSRLHAPANAEPTRSRSARGGPEPRPARHPGLLQLQGIAGLRRRSRVTAAAASSTGSTRPTRIGSTTSARSAARSGTSRSWCRSATTTSSSSTSIRMSSARSSGSSARRREWSGRRPTSGR